MSDITDTITFKTNRNFFYMKKILFSAAIILSGLVGFTVSAQNPEGCTPNTCEQPACNQNHTTCCAKSEKPCCAKDAPQCAKDGKRHKGHKDGKGMHKGKRHDFFEGINLTPEQQSALSDLRPARGERTEKQAKDNDKKISREDRAKEREARFTEYKNKVKEILTPEQYTTFEQNVSNFQAKREDFAKHGKKNDCDKGCKDRKADMSKKEAR